MPDKDIDKIPITVEVPKADVWVRADYRDIVRRLGAVHMIRACEHQHDDDFVPLYDSQTVAGYQVEAERLRERNKRLMAHDLVAAEQAAYERGIRRAAAICYELGEKVMHPTQTITRRCEAAILAEIGEKP